MILGVDGSVARKGKAVPNKVANDLPPKRRNGVVANRLAQPEKTSTVLIRICEFKVK